MYSFSRSAFQGLKDAAAEAVQRLYESGIAIRDSRVGPGHNNVMADNAAKAFSPEDLDVLSQSVNPLEQAFSQMISLRQDYIKVTHGDDPKGQALLQKIYDLGQQMKTLGWQPRSESVRTIQSSSVPHKAPAAVDHFNYDRAQLEAWGAQERRTPKP